MKFFWYQKTMIGRWGACGSDERPTQKATDGTKALPLGPIYDLVKLSTDNVDYTTLPWKELLRLFLPPDDAGAPAPLPDPGPAPVTPAAAAPLGFTVDETLRGFQNMADALRPLTENPELFAPYGLGIEGIKAAYVAFVRSTLDNTEGKRHEQVFNTLWKLKMSEGFPVVSALIPGEQVDEHIARASELIPGWAEDFRAFQMESTRDENHVGLV